MIRARVSEVFGDYALLDFDGILKIVSCSDLPKHAGKGDVLVYQNRRLVFDS